MASLQLSTQQVWGEKKIMADPQRNSEILFFFLMHISQTKLGKAAALLMISSVMIKHYLKPTENVIVKTCVYLMYKPVLQHKETRSKNLSWTIVLSVVERTILMKKKRKKLFF